MNFLAHLYLSGSSNKILVGNFIADFVKGKQIELFEDEIVKGILLHRQIDAFTDSHPIVSQSKLRLREKYRHYSGVLVDIFYDHYLAKNWHKHSELLLHDFARISYETIIKHNDILPPKVIYMLPFMIKNNWLVNYANLEGIERVLQGMSRRTSFVSNMEFAVNDLKEHYQQFEEEFNLFFPELVQDSAMFLQQIKKSRP
jgi:acyl carrier protein phosphodiesterase